MKNSTLFCSMAAAGILALCNTGYAADAANLPRRNAAPAVTMAAPGEKLVLHFRGAERIFMDGSGRLEVTNADGAVLRYRPAMFQIIGGKRKTVTFSCHVIDADHVELKAIHPDPAAPLELAPIHALGTTS
jgi:hypothetical protein